MAQNRKARRASASKARKRKLNGASSDAPMRLHGAQLRKIQHSDRALLQLKARHSDLCRQAQNLGGLIEQRQAEHNRLARTMIEALGIEIDSRHNYRIDSESGAIITTPVLQAASELSPEDGEAAAEKPSDNKPTRKRSSKKTPSNQDDSESDAAVAN